MVIIRGGLKASEEQLSVLKEKLSLLQRQKAEVELSRLVPTREKLLVRPRYKERVYSPKMKRASKQSDIPSSVVKGVFFGHINARISPLSTSARALYVGEVVCV